MDIIYTDGSCLGNTGNSPGGWAFAWITTEKIWYVSGAEEKTTNNRMELEAVIQALKFCTANIITIYSDSLYVINGITLWITKWIKRDWKKVKNIDLWLELYQLSQTKKITWKHVKAHNGDFYNEEVDKLAKKEAMSLIK